MSGSVDASELDCGLGKAAGGKGLIGVEAWNKSQRAIFKEESNDDEYNPPGEYDGNSRAEQSSKCPDSQRNRNSQAHLS